MSWNTNHNLQTQELEEAKQKHEQSEWVLNILRSQTSTPFPSASNEEILLWNKQLNSHPKQPIN